MSKKYTQKQKFTIAAKAAATKAVKPLADDLKLLADDLQATANGLDNVTKQMASLDMLQVEVNGIKADVQDLEHKYDSMDNKVSKLAANIDAVANFTDGIEKNTIKLKQLQKVVGSNSENMELQFKDCKASIAKARKSAEKKAKAEILLLQSARKQYEVEFANSTKKSRQEIKHDFDNLENSLVKKLFAKVDDVANVAVTNLHLDLAKAKKIEEEAEAKAKEGATFLRSFSDWMWTNSKQ